MGMVVDTHPDHDFYQLFSEPADLGFYGTARNRTWVIGSHKERTCLADPFEVYGSIKAHCSRLLRAEVSDYLIATSSELKLEETALALSRNMRSYIPGQTPAGYLLNPRESTTRAAMDEKYRAKFQLEPMDNKNLVYFLGDSSEYCSWSATSQKIPTYRLNSKNGKYWLPHNQRLMTSKERLTSMGFPVSKEVAQAMAVPMMGATDCKRAGDILGNSMHFQTSGIMQLLSLACFGPLI